MTVIHCERAYDTPEHKDAYRALVDRLWPRGIKKEKLAHDEWLKTISPSTELRRWFQHDVDKWPEFQKRYRDELAGHEDELKGLLERAGDKPLVLVFSAKDREHNNAVVIKQYLESLS